MGYALVRSHPSADVARQIGPSTFPPADRKTSAWPMSRAGRFKKHGLFQPLVPHFVEAPRVPVKGKYRLKVVFEGDTTSVLTKRRVELVVNKAFPASISTTRRRASATR